MRTPSLRSAALRRGLGAAALALLLATPAQALTVNVVGSAKIIDEFAPLQAYFGNGSLTFDFSFDLSPGTAFETVASNGAGSLSWNDGIPRSAGFSGSDAGWWTTGPGEITFALQVAGAPVKGGDTLLYFGVVLGFSGDLATDDVAALLGASPAVLGLRAQVGDGSGFSEGFQRAGVVGTATVSDGGAPVPEPPAAALAALALVAAGAASRARRRVPVPA